MKFSEFLIKYNVGGSFTSPNNDYKGECVSLLKCYIKYVLGTEPQSIGNAKEYWNKRNGKYIKSFAKPLGKKDKLQVGDIFVRTSGTYGHCGIVKTLTNDGFISVEQNAGGCRVVKYLAHKKDEFNYLRPINQENLIEKKHKPNVKVGKAYHFTTNAYLYKDTRRTHYLVNELTKLTSKDNARLQEGSKIKVTDYKEVNGDVWVKYIYNKKTVISLVYNYSKDKCYIK